MVAAPSAPSPAAATAAATAQHSRRRRAPSPPSMIGLPLDDSESDDAMEPALVVADTADDHVASLEDRVRDLETKLATLSRLLQQQQALPRSPRSSLSPRRRTPSPPLTTPPETPPRSARTSTPHLESPTPFAEEFQKSAIAHGLVEEASRQRQPRRSNLPPRPSTAPHHGKRPAEPTVPKSSMERNLSLKLLFDGDEAEYEAERRRASAPPTNSMTASERQWLEPQILEFQSSQASTPTAETNGRLLSLSHYTSGPQAVQDSVRNTWLSYLNSYQESTPDMDALMQEFIQVPGKVESIMSFGLFVCADSFLYMIAILPIRFVWSCCLLVWLGVRKIRPQPTPLAFCFHRRHSYQLIQVTMVYTIYRFVLSAISIGKLYHWIRGQTAIKLYVMIAMVEVFDRLFSSLGQDCLDSMYWNTVNRPRSSRMVVSVAVVWVYATLHSLLLLVHVETLNVAMNSADQALLTLLISGNFAEIKSTVFKKYNKPALFKITANDICERFKLGLFLSLVLLLNVCQGMEKGQFKDYIKICVIVWLAELLSDWIKHAFITKFNFLPSKVYPEYQLLLAGDVTGIGHEGVNVDHSHAVVKRIGFAQIPLVCVMFRLLREAAKYARRNPHLQSSFLVGSWWYRSTVLLASWLLLLLIKTALGRLLLRTSLNKLRAAPEVIPPKKLPKEKKH